MHSRDGDRERADDRDTCTSTGTNTASASEAQRVVLKASVDAGGAAAGITAVLLQSPTDGTSLQRYCSGGAAGSGGGRLRLLRPISLQSVPPMLFQRTFLVLRLNTDTESAQRYVNGLVHQLMPPTTVAAAAAAATNKDKGPCTGERAVLARVDVSSSDPMAYDPFVSQPVSPNTTEPVVEWLADGHSYALIYASRDSAHSPWHLGLHMLEPPHALGPLGVANSCALALHMREQRVSEAELDYVRLLARKSSEQARIQRSLSSENMLMAEPLGRRRESMGGSVGSLSAGRSRHGRMTLTDIETLLRQQTLGGKDSPPRSQAAALGKPPLPPPSAAASAEPSPETEQKNKRVAKQLIITSLKERGVGRSHPDFNALWSQIYRSLKFALRDKLGRREYAPRELKAEAEKHASFYFDSTNL
ncbi:hypothetical protein GGI07_001983 [Coemansia sp. Benny D115]|nr:hypothetical protein GGI07_001983 [Coemansia sp. Benny D115]